MIYRGFHVLQQSGRWMVYGQYDKPRGMYVDRKGSFNSATEARRWVNELRRVRPGTQDGTLTEPGARGVAQPSARYQRSQSAGLEPRRSEEAELAPPAGQDAARPVDAPGSVSASPPGTQDGGEG